MLSRLLLLAIFLLAPLGGCFGEGVRTQSDKGTQQDPNCPILGEDDMGGGLRADCATASDCVLAASTCCGCPSFAAPAGEGYEGCEEVNCEPSGLCPAVQAICDTGSCLLVCSPLIADQICAFGFIADEAGCLLNECAASPMSTLGECESDADCVQVPADCCGCALGGADKSVPLAQAGEEADLLNCPVAPACPGIDVCSLEESAQCIAGTCTLALASGLDVPTDPSPTLLCGSPELPACATGTVCVLNDISANDASSLGVGTCVAL